MNNKITNILLGILIVVLIAIGIILVKGQSNRDYRSEINQQNALDSIGDYSNNPVTTDNSNSTTSVVATSNPVKQVNWSSVPISSIENLIKKTEIPMEGKPQLSTEVQDLTGDGIKEGVYGLPSGNAGITIIAMTNSDGSVSLAKMKNKNGSISPVQLWSTGMASYSMSYKFLPSEHGFYSVSKTLDESADNSEYSHLICKDNYGVEAYQWNSKTSLFEYNSALTAKYTAIECK